jgi:hypothetical protein
MRAISTIVLAALVLGSNVLGSNSFTAAAELATGDRQPAESGKAGSSTAAGPRDAALRAFDAWAARQELYSADSIAAMRSRLLAKFASLSADHETSFSDELLAKIDIFSQTEAYDAEHWLAETLAVASDAYAQKIIARLPDLVDDSPQQVRSKLRAFAVRAINVKQVRQGFDTSRQSAVEVLRQDERRQENINAQLRASMTYSTPNLYSPTIHNGPPPYQRYSGYFNRRYASPFSYSFRGMWFF